MIDSMFVLVDEAGTHWWTGTGFMPIAACDPNEARDVAQFRSHRQAETEAMRMGALTNVHLRPVRVRLLVGDVIDEPATTGTRSGKHAGSARIVFAQNET